MAQPYPESFDDFLTLVRQEVEPLRLLLVFARREPSAEAAPTPVALVDKDPGHLQSHAALADEARDRLGHWDALFVGVLPGANNQQPSAQAIDQGGDKMVQAICNGSIGSFLVFDREGQPLQLDV